MAMSSNFPAYKKVHQIFCRKKERDRDQIHPYKVVEITPPPRNLGVRCLSPNLQCGESVTIEGKTYTISAVTHRYQLRKAEYIMLGLFYKDVNIVRRITVGIGSKPEEVRTERVQYLDKLDDTRMTGIFID